ncbi:MarR family transcriptional regulator [Micromonospora sp. NPDC049559]|uniref:MarR family winged helix-turn-helix transcriptional regulator n=1 Tax=Micromonospora sp. NPDC049559 TaxID=3155923 RepID=UPI003433A484
MLPTDPAPGAADVLDRAALAGDVVRQVERVAAAMHRERQIGLAKLGLTPAVARALHELDPDRPLPARALADSLGCDKSNITALVDKLEQAGLVQRRSDPADRRLKTILVTDAGRRIRAEVRELAAEFRLLDGLTDAELGTLRELIGKVSNAACDGDPCDDAAAAAGAACGEVPAP